MKTLLTALLIFLPSIASANNILSHKLGIWSLPSAESMKRWVIIHNLEESRESGIFHIEVIGRENGDARWQIKRLVAHMAITDHALKNSVVNPLKKGGVYPETFDNAYSKWKDQNKGKGGNICKTTVLKCM